MEIPIVYSCHNPCPWNIDTQMRTCHYVADLNTCAIVGYDHSIPFTPTNASKCQLIFFRFYHTLSFPSTLSFPTLFLFMCRAWTPWLNYYVETCKLVGWVWRWFGAVLPTLQSGFRPGDGSFEWNRRALISGALILLDLTEPITTSAADLRRQRCSSMVSVVYISSVGHNIRTSRHHLVTHHPSAAWCGLESVLGPLLFILYTIDLIQLIERLGMASHMCADGTQVRSSWCPSDLRYVYVVHIRLPERHCLLNELE